MRRLALVLLLSGCAHFPKGTPAGKDAGANAVLTELAQLHGVQAKPVAVQPLDEPTFVALVQAQLVPDPVFAESTQAGWRAFGFSPLSIDLRALSKEPTTEQLGGQYDDKRHVLVVPAPKTDADPLELRQLLLHEVEHALQDQRFGPMPRTAHDDDALRAARAVYESDAMLSLLLGQEKGKGDSKEELASLHQALGRVEKSIFEYLSFGPFSRVRAAPESLRRLVLFPYTGALPLLIALQQQGGYALRDHAFHRLPESTEQLLHLDKYRSGEQPIEVSPPVAPEGFRRLSGGTLGELGIRSLLSTCMSAEAAAASASGWGGDAYTALSSATPTPGLLWSTVWDDEAHAIQFERALHELEAYWRDNDVELSQGLTIERRGTRVALTRGPKPEGATLFALVPERGRAHPRVLPALPDDPIVAVPVHHPARIETHDDGAMFVDDELGLEAPIPDGAQGTVSQPGLRVAVMNGGAMGLVSLAARVYSSQSAEQFFADTYASVGRALARGEELIPLEQASRVVETGFAKGLSRSWRVSDSGRMMRAILVPVCGGKASLGFAFAGAQEGVEGLEEWLQSFALRTGSAPACERL